MRAAFCLSNRFMPWMLSRAQGSFCLPKGQVSEGSLSGLSEATLMLVDHNDSCRCTSSSPSIYGNRSSRNRKTQDVSSRLTRLPTASCTNIPPMTMAAPPRNSGWWVNPHRHQRMALLGQFPPPSGSTPDRRRHAKCAKSFSCRIRKSEVLLFNI